LLSDAFVDKVASLPAEVEGMGLAEFFAEAPDSHSHEPRFESLAVEDHDDVVNVLATSSLELEPFAADPEVADSTKLCDFLANLASKKLVQPLVEIPAAIVVSSTTAVAEAIQVDPEDSITDKCNAFLSSVFRPVPPPILATPAPRRARAPKEVATTPRRSDCIEKKKRKDAANACSTSTTEVACTGFGPPGRERGVR